MYDLNNKKKLFMGPASLCLRLALHIDVYCVSPYIIRLPFFLKQYANYKIILHLNISGWMLACFLGSFCISYIQRIQLHVILCQFSDSL